MKRYLLRRGGTNAMVDATLKRLRELNYIDDVAFARHRALYGAQSRGYGPKKIAWELETKGVEPEIIRTAVRETFEQENEAERAREVLRKQFGSENLQAPSVRRRAAAFLQRRGYSNQTISALLSCPIDENC